MCTENASETVMEDIALSFSPNTAKQFFIEKWKELISCTFTVDDEVSLVLTCYEKGALVAM